jgi:hypothetical protein
MGRFGNYDKLGPSITHEEYMRIPPKKSYPIKVEIGEPMRKHQLLAYSKDLENHLHELVELKFKDIRRDIFN